MVYAKYFTFAEDCTISEEKERCIFANNGHGSIGVRPSQARLGPARLVSIRGKKLGKARLGAGSKIFGSIVARLEIGSKNFGSQLGSA